MKDPLESIEFYLEKYKYFTTLTSKELSLKIHEVNEVQQKLVSLFEEFVKTEPINTPEDFKNIEKIKKELVFLKEKITKTNN